MSRNKFTVQIADCIACLTVMATELESESDALRTRIGSLGPDGRRMTRDSRRLFKLARDLRPYTTPTDIALASQKFDELPF